MYVKHLNINFISKLETRKPKSFTINVYQLRCSQCPSTRYSAKKCVYPSGYREFLNNVSCVVYVSYIIIGVIRLSTFIIIGISLSTGAQRPFTIPRRSVRFAASSLMRNVIIWCVIKKILRFFNYIFALILLKVL